MFWSVFLTALALVAAYAYRKLHDKRFKDQRYAHLPQLPPSFLLGHLKAVDDCLPAGKPHAHPGKLPALKRVSYSLQQLTMGIGTATTDYAFITMNEALGKPPLMLVDMRPIDRPVVIVKSHEVAEQISRASGQYPYSLPKDQRSYDHMKYIQGKTAISAAQVCLPPCSTLLLLITYSLPNTRENTGSASASNSAQDSRLRTSWRCCRASWTRRLLSSATLTGSPRMTSLNRSR